MQMISLRRLAFSTALALSFAGLSTSAQAGTVFTVQLGSYESEKEARAQWSKLQSRFPDLFEPLNYASAKVQLPPDDFVYYRTQAGPIATRSDADDICRRLVVKGFECYVAETAMFMADGEDIQDEASAEAKQVAEATPPPPPPPLPADVESEKEMFDLLEAEEAANIYKPTAPAALPAPQKPEPIVTVGGTKEAEPKKEKSSSFFSFPWLSSSDEEEEKHEEKKEMAAAAPAAGLPFEKGQSSYAGNITPVAPAPVPPVPAQPVPVAKPMAPPVPVTQRDMAELKVAEAVPVPLGDIPSTPVASPGYNTSKERGMPSQQFSRPTLWAEVSYFTTQDAALGYWRTLRGRDSTIPQGLRLRVVKPLRQRGGTERLSLRIGPFDNANIIRRLCSHTAPEKLRCQAMRDVGSSVAGIGQPRQRLSEADAYAARNYRTRTTASPFSAPAGSGGTEGVYWVQLGAFPSMEMAKSQWSALKSAHPVQLSKLQEQIQPPGYSSASRPMYRLRVGPFVNNPDASNLCRSLKNAGTVCLVVSGR